MVVKKRNPDKIDPKLGLLKDKVTGQSTGEGSCPAQPMSLEDFKNLIRETRATFIKTEELVCAGFEQALQQLGANTNNLNSISQVALQQTSELITLARERCWIEFLLHEKELCRALVRELFPLAQLRDYADGRLQELQNQIGEYAQTYFYELALSNTQSRRTRAGSEFEILLSLILLASGVDVDQQGNIGKTKSKKRVDLVVPSITHYEAQPQQTVIISVKTTIRERWQEVVEEQQRLEGKCARMYLATLDHEISSQTIKLLCEDRDIYLVVLKDIKQELKEQQKIAPKIESKVLSFEEMLQQVHAITASFNYAAWPEEVRQRLWDKYAQGSQSENLLYRICYQHLLARFKAIMEEA